MGRRPRKMSIARIASEAGVAESTVSRVLRHKAHISEETRRRVIEITRKHEFSLDSYCARKKKIAVLMGSGRFVHYTSEILNGIYEYADEHDVNICVILQSSKTESDPLAQIRDQQCAGVIVISPSLVDSLGKLANSELPVVLVDETTGILDLGFVDHSAYAGSWDATLKLIELGHSRIGYLTYDLMTVNHTQRFNAYKNALSESGLEFKDTWVRKADSSLSSFKAGVSAFEKLIRKAPELTAVMACDDDLAVGVLRAAASLGISVPDDISVIGFDNYECSEFTVPALTTVEHPIRKAAFLATRAVDESINASRKMELPKDTLPTRLVLRESHAPPRASSELQLERTL